jgi:hypothetical protein
MSNKLLLKRSNVPSKVPTAAQVVAGELAINTADELLYFGTGNSVHRVAKHAELTAISTHSGLQGLTNDDHTQYVHLDISRTVSAQHTFNPSALNAPFILGANAVGQKVTGFNSDLLDGYNSSDFVLASTLGTNVATLDANGKLNPDQVPSIAITDTYVVASQTEMLALSSATIGSVAIRTDESKSYILKANDPTVLANWQELISPTAAVTSVNGQQGIVTLDTSNIAENTNLYFTNARARAAISATGSLSYNSSTGTISFTDAVVSVAGRQGAVTLTNVDVGLGNVENKSSATIRSEITSANVTTALGFTPEPALGFTAQPALGFTPENAANKNAANGYVGLDATAKIDALYLSATALTAALGFTPENAANKNQVNGYAGLDATGKIDPTYLPATAQTAVTAVYAGSVAQQSGNTTMNVSTTAPTTIMGTQVVSQTLTPSALTSKLDIEFAGIVDCSSNGSTVNIAVFRGTTFIGMSSVFLKTAGQLQPFSLKIIDEPNTTSPVTYSIRVGTTAGTWYLGRGQTNTFGGVNPSGWSITQYY